MANVGEEPIEEHHGGGAESVLMFGRQHPVGDIADHDPAPEV
ncbi:MAG: hypothetical protein ACRDXD_03390 [Acidimicrobiia bacterium]